jgi:peroxiredoxin Q/BCP
LTLIKAIGLQKAPKSTTRGVFVVDKEGKVLAAEPGGPEPTVNVVKKLVASMGGDAKEVEKAEETAKEGEE